MPSAYMSLSSGSTNYSFVYVNVCDKGCQPQRNLFAQNIFEIYGIGTCIICYMIAESGLWRMLVKLPEKLQKRLVVGIVYVPNLCARQCV